MKVVDSFADQETYFSYEKSSDTLLPLQYESQVYKECVKGGKAFIRVVACDFNRKIERKEECADFMKKHFPAFTVPGTRRTKRWGKLIMHPVHRIFIDTSFATQGSAEFESIFYHELGHIANGDLDDSFNDLKNVADQWNAATTLQEKNSVVNNFNATEKKETFITAQNEIAADEYADSHSSVRMDFEKLCSATREFYKTTQNRDGVFIDVEERIEAQKMRMGKGADERI